MKSFKYYGSTTVLKLRILLTVILFAGLLLLRGDKSSTYDSHFLILFLPLVSSYILSKIVKRLPIKVPLIKFDDKFIFLPKKYYWSNKENIKVSINSINFLYRIYSPDPEGIYIDFVDMDGNFSQLTLEALLFESKSKFIEFFSLIISELNFELVKEGHQYFSESKDVYSRD